MDQYGNMEITLRGKTLVQDELRKVAKGASEAIKKEEIDDNEDEEV